MPGMGSGPKEANIGLELFYTQTRGIGGRLKKSPEDFIVEEISDYPERADPGRYTIARVTSTNWEMNRLVRQLSKSLHISRAKIGFAGTKDKRAVTTQLISFEAPLEEVSLLQIHQVSISDPYRSKRPINIGDLVGNKFQIDVRDCDPSQEEAVESATATSGILKELGGYPNFFGVQRFGAIRPITHEVGKKIVRGDFEGAVMVYAANPTEEEGEDSRTVRRELGDSMDFEKAIRTYPKKLTFERMVIGHLARYPDDYVGALKTLPHNLLMMFVHAFQSYIFNRILSERIRRGMPLNFSLVGDVVLPSDRLGLPDHEKYVPVTEQNIDLVNKQVKNGKAFVSGVLFGTESILADGEMGEVERKIIEEEKVQTSDFLVPAIPQCSSKGTRRELLGPFKDFSIEGREESIHFSFSLAKGCYATSLMREFMKSDLMNY